MTKIISSLFLRRETLFVTGMILLYCGVWASFTLVWANTVCGIILVLSSFVLAIREFVPELPAKMFNNFLAIVRFLFLVSNDVLVLAGITVIIWSNFRVNNLFGWYSVGVALILVGLGLTRLIRRKSHK